jgi:hypothetical protein
MITYPSTTRVGNAIVMPTLTAGQRHEKPSAQAEWPIGVTRSLQNLDIIPIVELLATAGVDVFAGYHAMQLRLSESAASPSHSA